MTKAKSLSRSRFGSVDRRRFLAQCAGAAALSGVASRAFADDPLDALMGDGRAGQFGQDFDQASRTIHMPKAYGADAVAGDRAVHPEGDRGLRRHRRPRRLADGASCR